MNDAMNEWMRQEDNERDLRIVRRAIHKRGVMHEADEALDRIKARLTEEVGR